MGTVFGDNEEGEEKMSSKYGRITKYTTVFVEPIDSKIKDYVAMIQICERAKAKTPTIQVYVKHTPISDKHKASSWAPSHKGLRALIDAFISVYGKTEVEKKLGIKIK